MQATTLHKKPEAINIESEMIGLYHSLQNELRNNSNFTIQFISAHRKEGVSTIIHEFARAAGNIFGKSVLILDLDNEVTKKQDSTRKDNNIEEGDSNNDSLEYSIKLQALDGFYISRLAWKETGLPVIHNNNYFEKILLSLKKKYDIVILDTPPPSKSPIGLAVAGKVDGVVLVVAAETTRWPVVERLRQQVEKVGGLLLGSILNQQKRYIPDFIYNHYI